MADIEYIHNVTSATTVLLSIPSWSTSIQGMPNQNPDECVIRSITFNNMVDDEDKFVYMIWSNLTNGFIGSVLGGTVTSVTPGTRIRLNGAVPNELSFKLFVPAERPSNPSQPQPLPVVVDYEVTCAISINMDSIKYKNVPPHA